MSTIHESPRMKLCVCECECVCVCVKIFLLSIVLNFNLYCNGVTDAGVAGGSMGDSTNTHYVE